ncbi:hypothetical protein [Streptomyces sp. NBC_00572]|uniref:hypothetical protein n=1 Tax=Streptomyces sp. NBC_00572 TaxID=2903664 RepID=UPI00225B7A5D|nr:hypothetical protein [Streptomyces sp. NBC_00572]MCX4985321.1 hypothetical protein [Streptomyces sp. NBC_00572]
MPPATTIDGSATEACDCEVAVDGGARQPASTATPGPAEFQVDDAASFLDIAATPHSPEFRPVQGPFTFQSPDSGSLIPIDARCWPELTWSAWRRVPVRAPRLPRASTHPPFARGMFS